jgi:hypothetical protein
MGAGSRITILKGITGREGGRPRLDALTQIVETIPLHIG